MWDPKLRTPGMDRSSRLARVAMRRSSATDVPGLVIQCIKKSRSLNCGNSDSPSHGNTATPANMMRAVAMKTGRGRWRMPSSTGW